MQELLDKDSVIDQGLSGLGFPPGNDQITTFPEVDERPGRIELRRQIARLERELGATFADVFPRGGIDWSVPPTGGPRILGMRELEEVRDSLALRISDIKGLLDDRAELEGRNRELIERMVADPERYKWVRVSNVDIGEPGCRHWHARPRLGIIGMLMGWWRVKLSSGCPLAEGRRDAASRTKKR